MNAWLEQQKLEHAAKVHEAQQVKERQEHEAAKESLRDKLDRSMEPLGHPVARLNSEMTCMFGALHGLCLHAVVFLTGCTFACLFQSVVHLSLLM